MVRSPEERTERPASPVVGGAQARRRDRREDMPRIASSVQVAYSEASIQCASEAIRPATRKRGEGKVGQNEDDFREAIRQIYLSFQMKLDPLAASRVLVDFAETLGAPIGPVGEAEEYLSDESTCAWSIPPPRNWLRRFPA